jgi:3-oxoacyl-[acyl-carrier-protein] synthase III
MPVDSAGVLPVVNPPGATPISIAGMALSLPEHTRSSVDIAARAGLRLDYVEDFLGIRRVFVPSAADQPCAMGVRAARVALQRARVEPETIDLILYVGSDYKEHVSWTAALKLQKDLGAKSAVAFDVTQTCTSLMTGFCVASAMMRTDPRITIALLAGGQRTIDHVDYANPLTHFLLNTSALRVCSRRTSSPTVRSARMCWCMPAAASIRSPLPMRARFASWRCVIPRLSVSAWRRA